MLLLARDDEGDGGRMSDAQVRDEAMTIFLAGHETTANALAWTWHLLAQHPDVEGRLHQEMDAALDRRPATAADAARLPYARMVLAESMRLYPPAWAVGRRALEDVEIGGYTIPKGTVVLFSQYLLHRDARFFPDPDRFDPDRWLPDRQKGRPKFAYFPFGGGTRVCIGESVRVDGRDPGARDARRAVAHGVARDRLRSRCSRRSRCGPRTVFACVRR